MGPVLQPSRPEITALRESCGLSTAQAAALLYHSPEQGAAWERGGMRMPRAVWDLFRRKCADRTLWELRTVTPTRAEVRAVREQAGLTQTQAAALLFLNPGVWSKWETGRFFMHPALFELFKIKTGLL